MWLRVLVSCAVIMAVPGVMPQSTEPFDPVLLQALTWRQLRPADTEMNTASLTDISANTAFPYRVCGRRPDQGTTCLSSHEDLHPDTSQVWHLTGAAYTGASAPDPLNPNVLYLGGVFRADRRTGHVQDVSPDGVAVTSPTGPLLFAPRDPRTLYFAAEALWTTTTGGRQWTVTRPASHDRITTLAPSPVDRQLLWLGTHEGRVSVTRNGGVTWTDMTPSALPSGGTMAHLEASHFDTNTAYVVPLSPDRTPQVLRTRDGGRTWRHIVDGLPDDAPVHVVREDPVRRGLLLAAGDRAVFVSFDDGDSWQSLQLNMPVTSVRALIVKDDDLVIGTADRGFWILDDITPLRQLTVSLAKAPAYLFRPPIAWRVRGQSAPAGASISYALGAGVDGPVMLEIVEVDGPVVRTFTNLPTTPGLHRMHWDLRQTPHHGEGVWTLPGTYQVRLTVGGTVMRQAVTVRMDPRVDTSVADVTLQFRLSKSIHDRMVQLDAQRAGATPAQLIEIERLYAPLPALFRALQAADARPTAAQEAAVAAALSRTESPVRAATSQTN